MKYDSRGEPMTPDDVRRSVEPDPQNDEICRLRSALTALQAEVNNLKEEKRVFINYIEEFGNARDRLNEDLWNLTQSPDEEKG